MQKKANCIIGTDYPSPMLDEHVEKDKCIARLKAAYALGLHGDAPEAMDGSAEAKLRAEHKESGVSADDADQEGSRGVKSEKEKQEEKGKRKREQEGNTSLDGHVKVEPKSADAKAKGDKPLSKKVKKETSNADGAQEEEEAVSKNGKEKSKEGHGKEVEDEEADEQVKETVQADSEHGAKHQKAEQGDSGAKARNLSSKAK